MKKLRQWKTEAIWLVGLCTLFAVLTAATSLSEILCVGHNMRSVDAPKTEIVPV